MIKLKTLKNLEREFEFEQEAVWIESLRAEAIKWIKELLNNHLQMGLNKYEAEERIDWIKHFFNITDEELK